MGSCQWYVLGGGQGCCYTFYNSPQQMIIQPKMSVILNLRHSVYRMQSLMKFLCSFRSHSYKACLYLLVRKGGFSFTGHRFYFPILTMIGQRYIFRKELLWAKATCYCSMSYLADLYSTVKCFHFIVTGGNPIVT